MPFPLTEYRVYKLYFSGYNHIWGWASWRRVWQSYDVEMKLWPEVRDNGWLQDLLGDYKLAQYWRQIFDRVYLGEIDTWDYQWTFACWVQICLTILPNVNLVCNIAFNEDATHTSHENNKLANIPAAAMDFPLRHPLL